MGLDSPFSYSTLGRSLDPDFLGDGDGVVETATAWTLHLPVPSQSGVASFHTHVLTACEGAPWLTHADGETPAAFGGDSITEWGEAPFDDEQAALHLYFAAADPETALSTAAGILITLGIDPDEATLSTAADWAEIVALTT